VVASDWKYLFGFFLALLCLIVIAELIRKRLHGSAETTRKIVHIITGLIIAVTPFVLHSMWPMVILGCLFAAVDYVAIKHKLIRAMHGTNRATYGTVFYPISFVILVVLLWDHHRIILVSAMLIMALADAAAGIVGETVTSPRILHFGPEKKSLQGSIAMYSCSFAIITLCLSFFPYTDHPLISFKTVLWIGAVAAFIATVCETISFRGSDNLTVPLGSAFSLYYMLNGSHADLLAFTIGAAMALGIAIVSYRLKFLDAGGAATAFLLGTLVFGVGRWAFTFPILTFFIFSSVLSKIGKKRKNLLDGVFEKTGCRDLGQVLANGGIATLILLLWYFFPSSLFYFMYLGSLAAVTADTWGTEIGVLSKSKPISILTFKTVATGTSGGISFYGNLGAISGSLLLTLIGIICFPYRAGQEFGAVLFLFIVSSGFIASLIDSLVGATVQAQYQCQVCHKMTEKKNHCQRPSLFVRGYRWINNDVVNIICALAGAFFVWLGWWLLRG
jgi:uncharacterized protein (TIGR00297 family)